MRALLVLLAVPLWAADPPDPKSLASYAFDPAKPLEQRLEPAPEWLLDVWRYIDKSPAYRNHTLTPAERAEFLSVLRGLPPRLRRMMELNLIGFYFIDGLMGNGVTDWVLDAGGRTHYYMLLNPAGFGKSLSRTLSERESSAFVGGGVRVDAGPGGSGMLYTLLHESGHAYDYNPGITRYVEPGHGKRVGRFAPGGWDVWADYAQPKPTHDFTGRAELKFYGFSPPEVLAKSAPTLCESLKRSDFTSFYGSRSWADDVAELFVFDQLTRAQKRPWKYTCGGKTFDMATPAKKTRAARILKGVLGS